VLVGSGVKLLVGSGVFVRVGGSCVLVGVGNRSGALVAVGRMTTGVSVGAAVGGTSCRVAVGTAIVGKDMVAVGMIWVAVGWKGATGWAD
jgi:hypothetical protein